MFSLGLGDNIVGVTTFCDYPEEAKKKPKIGGMSNPSLEAIITMKPDLVVMTTDGNPKDIQERLNSLNIKTYVFAARRLFQLPQAIREMGAVLQVQERANTLAQEIDTALKKAGAKGKARGTGPKKKVLFIVWPEPLIVAGPGTAMDDAIALLGHDNIAHTAMASYPKYSLEEVIRSAPDVIFIGKGSGMDMREVSKGMLERMASVPAVRNKAVFYLSDNLYRLGPRAHSRNRGAVRMSALKITVLTALALIVIGCSLFLGAHVISPFGMSSTEREIIFSIRLPRVLVAFLMGTALGASGALAAGHSAEPAGRPLYPRHIERRFPCCCPRHRRRNDLSWAALPCRSSLLSAPSERAAWSA